MNNFVVNIHVQMQVLLFLVHKYQEVELLGHMVILLLTF